ncbi:hypothetical protein RHMOL_Rhmol07G0249500 [Rhododendron molle]|nr:hypothetical protein RHMOL_Rhmol07G0249500 [Rhododendron molle]
MSHVLHIELHCQKKIAKLVSPGPEIRTGFLKGEKPIQLREGEEIIVSTDYTLKGDEKMISMSYQKLAVDLKPGNVILWADGTITLTVLSCDPANGTVRCRCENTAVLGERKNVNLPGIVVDLPTLTEKDKDDILQWGVPNNIDLIALSFVCKGSDLVNVRKVLGSHAKNIQLMSKVCELIKFLLVNHLLIIILTLPLGIGGLLGSKSFAKPLLYANDDKAMAVMFAAFGRVSNCQRMIGHHYLTDSALFGFNIQATAPTHELVLLYLGSTFR